MKKEYQCDYRRIQNAALNQRAEYFPLYEHNIHPSVIGQILGREIEALSESRNPPIWMNTSPNWGAFTGV